MSAPTLYLCRATNNRTGNAHDPTRHERKRSNAQHSVRPTLTEFLKSTGPHRYRNNRISDMKIRISPQEKKIRDYSHQRKNSFGENDKSSRRALRQRKRWVNRSFRRSVNNAIANRVQACETIDANIKSLNRPNWKKFPDELIIEHFDKKWSGSSRSKAKPVRSLLRKEAMKRLKKSRKLRDR